MKVIMVLMLVAILGALASAGIFMLKRREGTGEQQDRRMARALALRVGISIALFLLILLSWTMGWIKPSGIPVGV